MKDRLLANVSHELRTPLNAILGFSEMLADPSLAPASAASRTEYASIIHTSAKHLLSVVNLLLDMSKLEAGRYEIEPESFAVGPLVRNCVDMLRLKAEERNVVIDASAADGALEIIADKRACRQILLNLLSNAVKFTPPHGQVTVEIEVIAGKLEIAVSDTGIGISAEHLPRLGDPFFQARSGYDRTAEGAGLGLAHGSRPRRPAWRLGGDRKRAGSRNPGGGAAAARRPRPGQNGCGFASVRSRCWHESEAAPRPSCRDRGA